QPGRLTILLARAGRGDAAATDELFPLVYEELRTLAASHLSHERAGHTLQPTALVNEAYLRLIGPAGSDADISWDSRAHFFGAASRAIRRILTDHARTRNRDKRGGGCARIPIDGVDLAAPETGVDLVALDEALTRLAALDEQKARVVELRFFGGLTEEQAARVLGVSPSTVTRDWRFARSWLRRELSPTPHPPPGGDDGHGA
ncbi:MAG: sigma-70 family RNA polymerase sigma factor, partial [Phycisphaerales bacterium]